MRAAKKIKYMAQSLANAKAAPCMMDFCKVCSRQETYVKENDPRPSRN